MIIVKRAIYTNSESLPTSGVIGIVVGVTACILFLSGFAWLVKQRGRKEEQRARLGQTSRTTQNRANNAAPNAPNASNTRQRRRETDPEPLPLYEPRSAANQVVSPNDVSYDAPAAFDLAQNIAAAERTGVATSLKVAVSEQGTLPLMERMAQVQRGIGELNRLTAAAPAEGYPPHSIEALKITQLKQNIALMSDERAAASPYPAASTRRSSYELLEPVVEGTPEPIPDANTLYARMLEIQQLLAEVDKIMSQPASLEASMQVQTLRARIAEIMERNDSAPGPSSGPAPSFQQHVHISHTSPGRASGSLAIAEPGQSGLGGRTGSAALEEPATPGPRDLPPPYQAGRITRTDDYAGAGATSVR